MLYTMKSGELKAFGDISGAEKSYYFNDTTVLQGYAGVTQGFKSFDDPGHIANL